LVHFSLLITAVIYLQLFDTDLCPMWVVLDNQWGNGKLSVTTCTTFWLSTEIRYKSESH